LDRPVIRWVLDMLKQENWWMMVSNGNSDRRWTPSGTTRFLCKGIIEAAPDRPSGHDWPHPQWTKRMMNDAEEVELLYLMVDGDTTLLRKIW